MLEGFVYVAKILVVLNLWGDQLEFGGTRPVASVEQCAQVEQEVGFKLQLAYPSAKISIESACVPAQKWLGLTARPI